MQKNSANPINPQHTEKTPILAGQNSELSADLQAELQQDARKGTIVCKGPSWIISEQISLNVKQQYIITPQLLLGTPVSQLKRAVLRSWLCEESAKLRLDRLVVATAAQLVDMFLARGGVIELQDFQALGIAALLLANKSIANEVTIRIDYRLFPLSLINELQLKLCKTCNFRLNPITHVHILDELVALWNIFSERHSDLWRYGCRSEMLCQSAKVFNSRQLYELMDTIFLVVETYSHSIVDLCLHAFRYFLMRDYQVIKSLPKSIEDEVVIKFWINPQDQPLMNTSFPSIFTHFLQFIDTHCHSANLAHSFDPKAIVQDYLQLFLTNGFEELIFRSLSSERQTYKQTFNPLSLKISKSFFSLKKNQRKGSGETMSI